jgi:hypothetical protein
MLSAYALNNSDLYPSLTFDFMTAALDPRVSVVRSLNTATRVNSSGFVEIINANLPRFDYDPSTLAIRGLLIEGQASNLVLRSEEFEAINWTKTAAGTGIAPVVTANDAVSPDGTTDADLIVFNAGSNGAGDQSVLNGSSFTATAQPYTFSIWLKTSDASTKTVQISISGAGASIVTVSGTWARFSTTWSASVGAWAPRIRLGGGTTSATASLHVWGAQLEAGSSATSYIPTVALAVTRNADVVTITGTNFSDWWQAGKGSALVRARPSTVSGIRPLVQFDDNTGGNIIALRGNTTNPELYVRAGGSDQAQIDAGTLAANVRYRLAGAWATDNCAASVNSGKPVLDGVATIPVVTQARLGSDGTNYLNGHLESVDYYNERVLNAGLQVISSSTGRRSIFKPVLKTSIFA